MRSTVFFKNDISLLHHSLGDWILPHYAALLSQPTVFPTSDIDQPRLSLADLPSDVLNIILLQLDLNTLGRVAMTCRRLHNISLVEELWREVPDAKAIAKVAPLKEKQKRFTTLPEVRV